MYTQVSYSVGCQNMASFSRECCGDCAFIQGTQMCFVLHKEQVGGSMILSQLLRVFFDASLRIFDFIPVSPLCTITSRHRRHDLLSGMNNFCRSCSINVLFINSITTATSPAETLVIVSRQQCTSGTDLVRRPFSSCRLGHAMPAHRPKNRGRKLVDSPSAFVSSIDQMLLSGMRTLDQVCSDPEHIFGRMEDIPWCFKHLSQCNNVSIYPFVS